MKKEIKNKKFHQQLGGEKIKEMTVILLLSFNNTIIYDIATIKNNEQLTNRIAALENNVRGFSYVAVTENFNFIEYKRIFLSK